MRRPRLPPAPFLGGGAWLLPVAGTWHRLAFPRKAPWHEVPSLLSFTSTPPTRPCATRPEHVLCARPRSQPPPAKEGAVPGGRLALLQAPPPAGLHLTVPLSSTGSALPTGAETEAQRGRDHCRLSVCEAEACASRLDQPHPPLGQALGWGCGGGMGTHPTAEPPPVLRPSHRGPCEGTLPAPVSLGTEETPAPLVAPRPAQTAAFTLTSYAESCLFQGAPGDGPCCCPQGPDLRTSRASLSQGQPDGGGRLWVQGTTTEPCPSRLTLRP